MGYKKPTEVSRAHLEAALLPTHGKTYAVVSHKFVIESTIKLLQQSNFIIKNSIYRANKSCNVAQGVIYIEPMNNNPIFDGEDDLSMMFAWTNSYDKTTRFQCAIGAYVDVCSNGMICGEMSFARKHTGTAKQEIYAQITNQIMSAEKTFIDIIRDKDQLKNTPLNLKNQSELLGRLYCDEELLEPSHLSVIKTEMKKASYDYGVDKENAWAFYNHVTHALKKTHPRTWMNDSKNFHDFMTTEFNNSSPQSQQDNAVVGTLDMLNIDIDEMVDPIEI